MHHQTLTRRDFLAASAASTLAATAFADSPRATQPTPRGRAQHCIFIWLGGGMAQVDTFAPKRRGNPASRQAGSAYASIPTAVPGVRVSEYLPRVAALMDRVTAVRSVHHNVVDEHAPATQAG